MSKRKGRTRNIRKPKTQTNNKTGNKSGKQEDKKKFTPEDFRNIMTVVIAFFALVVSILSFLRSGIALNPRFSLEVSKVDENDSENLNRIFKIYNVGGQISSPQIIPIMQMELCCDICDNKGAALREGSALIRLLDYFPDEYSYNNSESSFIVEETKANKLYDLIEKIDNNMLYENEYIKFLSIKYYFKISYFDYKGKKKEKILYPENNHALLDYQNYPKTRYFKNNELHETKSIKQEDISSTMDSEQEYGSIYYYKGDTKDAHVFLPGENVDEYMLDLIDKCLKKSSIKLGTDKRGRTYISKRGGVFIADKNGLFMGIMEKNRENNVFIIAILLIIVFIIFILLLIYFKNWKKKNGAFKRR